MRFPLLFSPFSIRDVTFKNRIFSTGHGTRLGDRIVTDALIAYHEARARGGAGLIVTEVIGVHETSYYVGRTLRGETDDIIPSLAKLAKTIHGYDCRIISQVFHAGREMRLSRDGSLPLAFAPSDVPNERFRVIPRAMTLDFIAELVDCYAATAARIAAAGMDGVEVLASHGYLLSQFLNPRINRRTDRYGGSIENRARFVVEIAQAIRTRIGPAPLLGLRFSANEPGVPEGMSEEESHALLAHLSPHFDYLNVTTGSVSTLESAPHSVPPMSLEPGYVGPLAGAVRTATRKPVFMSGRVNRADVAEKLLAEGKVDMCAMTRGLLADPELPNKARAGKVEDIRTCVGCNQACIGHNQNGFPVSCIQFPETGRELDYGTRPKATTVKRILVAGGGPGGLKAAAVAAERGHKVTLYERAPRLGGQVLLAEKLPGRMEFGGVAENLAREAERWGATILKGKAVDAALVRAEKPDAIIVATGATTRPLETEGGTEGANVVDAWQVIQGQANLGGSIVIADWRADWVGLGVAEMLAREGRKVRLAVHGYMAGEMIQQYVRDPWLGTLHKLGVEIVTMARLIGADSESAYFQHVMCGEPIIFEGCESLIVNMARQSDASLEDELAPLGVPMTAIGDALSPRTVEEAVLEGLKAAWVL
jgi:2,4-dienoyl-CoA reductase-like NADH-dependent reductase (Old Yellow Enzyme family)